MQRTRSPYRSAAHLLAMRDTLRDQLGPDVYSASTAPYVPALQAEMLGGHCFTTAANRVLERLEGAGEDMAVRRLVTCAAVDLALAS